jgi:Flp pilus assembly protein CpaB
LFCELLRRAIERAPARSLFTRFADVVAAPTFDATELGVADRLLAGELIGTSTGCGQPVIDIEIGATSGPAFLASLIDSGPRAIGVVICAASAGDQNDCHQAQCAQ